MEHLEPGEFEEMEKIAAAGDLPRTHARRLLAWARGCEEIWRKDGGEFATKLAELEDKSTAIDDVIASAEQLIGPSDKTLEFRALAVSSALRWYRLAHGLPRKHETKK